MSGNHPRTALAALAALAAAACTSPTVVQKSDKPQRREVPGTSDYSWEQKSGWVRPNRGKWGSDVQVRAESKKAFDAGAYADALEGYTVLKSRLPDEDPSLAEINFQTAECYYHLGNYEKALELYKDVYLKRKPEADVLSKTFQRVHDIAMDYLHERAVCSFLGLFSYNCPTHGIELLVGEDGLIKQYPNLSFADDAIYEIGKYYFEQRQYPEAVPVYERIVQEYPESEWRGPAQYYLALATFRQIRGVDYDEKLIDDAKKKFQAYIDVNPRGPQAEDARAKLQEISDMLGRKNLLIAKFYLREGEGQAARIYLRIVLEKYTSSSAAREAREINEQLQKY